MAKKDKKPQGISTLRKVFRNTGAGIFFVSAGTALGLGAANTIITFHKPITDFPMATQTYEGSFVWDGMVFTIVWGCVVLMMIGLGIYGATLKGNE